MAYELFAASPDFILTKGPYWDAENDRLLFSDSIGQTVCVMDYNEVELMTIGLESTVSAVIPRENHSSVICMVGTQICALDLETSDLEVLCDVEPGDKVSLSDAKCDASGRLWLGTMGKNVKGHTDEKLGSLYSFSPEQGLRKHIEEVGISSGLAWSLDNKIFYYIDAKTKTVVAYDFDLEKGAISNPRTCVDFERFEGPNVSADGMCIDSDGMIWVALCNAYKVVRCNPNNGTVIKSITLPVAQVTSCCFAGRNLDELIVTSGRVTLSDAAIRRQPLAASVFKIKDLGVHGFPGVPYKG